MILLFNFCSGILTTYQQIFYYNKVLKLSSILFTLTCYTVSCGFFVNAWRNLSTSIENETVIDMQDFGKFVVAFGMVCISELLLFLSIVSNTLVSTILYLISIVCIFVCELLLALQLQAFIKNICALEQV